MSRDDRPPGGMPVFVWFVYGTDQHGAPFDSEEPSREAADRVAGRINDKGGRLRVVRRRWNGPAAAYRDCPERPGGGGR